MHEAKPPHLPPGPTEPCSPPASAAGAAAVGVLLLACLEGAAAEPAAAALAATAADEGVAAAAGAAGLRWPASIRALPMLAAGLPCAAGASAGAAGDAAAARADCRDGLGEAAALGDAGAGERLGDLGGSPAAAAAAAAAGLRQAPGDGGACWPPAAAALGDSCWASAGLVRAAGVGDCRLARSKRKPGAGAAASAAAGGAAAAGEPSSSATGASLGLGLLPLRRGLLAGAGAGAGAGAAAGLSCALLPRGSALRATTGLASTTRGPPGAAAWASAASAAGASAGRAGNCGVAPTAGVPSPLAPCGWGCWKEKEGVPCGGGWPCVPAAAWSQPKLEARLCVGRWPLPKLKDTCLPAEACGCCGCCCCCCSTSPPVASCSSCSSCSSAGAPAGSPPAAPPSCALAAPRAAASACRLTAMLTLSMVLSAGVPSQLGVPQLRSGAGAAGGAKAFRSTVGEGSASGLVRSASSAVLTGAVGAFSSLCAASCARPAEPNDSRLAPAAASAARLGSGLGSGRRGPPSRGASRDQPDKPNGIQAAAAPAIAAVAR